MGELSKKGKKNSRLMTLVKANGALGMGHLLECLASYARIGTILLAFLSSRRLLIATTLTPKEECDPISDASGEDVGYPHQPA